MTPTLSCNIPFFFFLERTSDCYCFQLLFGIIWSFALNILMWLGFSTTLLFVFYLSLLFFALIPVLPSLDLIFLIFYFISVGGLLVAALCLIFFICGYFRVYNMHHEVFTLPVWCQNLSVIPPFFPLSLFIFLIFLLIHVVNCNFLVTIFALKSQLNSFLNYVFSDFQSFLDLFVLGFYLVSMLFCLKKFLQHFLESRSAGSDWF